MILLNKTIYSLRRSTITYLILIGVIFVAAIVQELSGFGFGTLAMAILPIFLAYKTCNMLVLSASLLIEIYTIIKLFKYIQWKLVIIPTFVSVIISILGTHLMLGLSTKTLSIIMACFLWIMAGYLSLIAPKLKVSANLFTGLIAGGLGGFMQSMFAAGGPPIVAYYNSIIDNPLTYQATVQTYFITTTLTILITDFSKGYLTGNLVFPGIICMISCLLGTIVGMRLLHKISMKTVRKAAYIVMLLAGCYMLYKGIF